MDLLKSKLLVYFHKESDVRSPVLSGQVSHRSLHHGRVTEYCFSSPETEFRQELRGALEESGCGESCFISSQLGQENGVCVLSVEGMTCNSCVRLIETTLGQEPGVRSIKVSLTFNEAFIEHDPGVIKPTELSERIFDMGFDAAVVTTLVLTPTPPSSPLPLLEPAQPAQPATPLSQMETTPPPLASVVISVEGMTCQSCVQNIESNLSKEKGVTSITVSLQAKTAELRFDATLTTPQKLADAIDGLGFQASLKDSSLSSTSSPTGSGSLGRLKVCYIGIDGMTCNSCVGLIESVVGDLEGVVSISVSLSCKEGTVEFNDASISMETISTAVQDMGFLVTYITGMHSPRPKHHVYSNKQHVTVSTWWFALSMG